MATITKVEATETGITVSTDSDSNREHAEVSKVARGAKGTFTGEIYDNDDNTAGAFAFSKVDDATKFLNDLVEKGLTPNSPLVRQQLADEGRKFLAMQGQTV